ncbi:tumor necrosis factor ligand superfamily member 6-like [Mercenaria mercenaria]|uniref:tumor necrosis factor ligand superfamily member 6-like n=1 Tax=Mercenaria mercenaria TaxID=6596 RepID=UPI00234F406E|nr:tumor necrosis factor ligand superfamily member 6-like [Mercenaria mercenaria]
MDIVTDNAKIQSVTDKKCTELFQVKRYFLFILICTTIGEMVTLLGLVGHWRVLREDIMSPRQQQMCLPLHRFTLVDDEEANDQCPGRLKKRLDKKKKLIICCGTLSDVLDKLSNKVVMEKYNSDANPEMSLLNLTNYKCEATNKKQPKAHLVDISEDKKPVSVGMSSKLLWNTDPPSYANLGLRYSKDDGTIYIEKTGHYYISSQLKTKIAKANDTDETLDSIFRHYVYLIKSEGTVGVILEDAKSQCEMVSDVSESTSVLGAVFHLEDGDRLYVSTSHPQNIISDKHNNYFSVFSLLDLK